MIRSALLLFLALSSFVVHAENAIPAPPQLGAKAYLLIDANSGAVLAEHNADMQLPPASLTKMMTAYVLAEEIKSGRVKEDDMVRITENSYSQNPLFQGSSLMWIEPGTDVSIADLQRGIIISSGNDSSVAVAEHIAGTEAVFAEMMNTNAKRLGMEHTHYVNSHGLPDPTHLTTARIDVAGVEDRRDEAYGAYRYLQLGAFGKEATARTLLQELQGSLSAPVFITPVQAGGALLYRVRIGPVDNQQQLLALQQQLQDRGYEAGQPLP